MILGSRGLASPIKESAMPKLVNNSRLVSPRARFVQAKFEEEVVAGGRPISNGHLDIR